MADTDKLGSENAGDEALTLFDSGLFCAESVLVTIARRQGLDPEPYTAMATGFCSGVGRSGGMCGAVSGAVMALGLVHGRNKAGETVEKCYAPVKTLVERFEKEFGTVNCAELLGCHLGTVEGQQAFREQKLISRCRIYTQRAAELTATLIDIQSSELS